MEFASGEKRQWLYDMGVRFFPVVGWAERGGYLAEGHGNSVPVSTLYGEQDQGLLLHLRKEFWSI